MGRQEAGGVYQQRTFSFVDPLSEEAECTCGPFFLLVT
jgi:hypothetical protein